MHPIEAKLYYIFMMSVIVIGTIIFYSILSLVRMQAKYRRLYNSRIESEVVKLEDERKRIAEDLHDECGPVLTSAVMKLSAVVPKDQQQEILINKALDYIGAITKRIREVATGLMPTVLHDKGAVRALEEFISKINDTGTTLQIILDAEELPPLFPHKSIHIYRILQEIIHNTIRHAGATKLLINIYTTKKNIVIATSDNGAGFNFKEKLKSNQGFGLRNISSRVQLLLGTLNVDDSKKKGTRYYIEIPL